MKQLLAALLLSSLVLSAEGQGTATSFVDFQRTLPRPAGAMARKEDTLQKQFRIKNLQWPAAQIYIRSFKYDGELEVWVRQNRQEAFKLFKTFRVCALAGTLGPKRMEGDYQVPEGFYYINEFNPRSNYHLSLGLNYPNPSDRLLSDSLKPGGDIYIHGSCVTVGCIPVNDQQIEELYILAAHAKNAGQDFIPVHIYPIRYDNKRGQDYLAQLTKTDPSLKTFADRLQSVYEHFELTRQLPVIMTNNYGEYVLDNLSKRLPPPPKPKRVPLPHRRRNVTPAEAVHQWPQFPGGGDHFLAYLEKTGKALKSSLPQGTKKANVTVEFIVDTDGVPVNFSVLKGVSEDFDDELITVLESMPTWKPALLNNLPVAWKVRQIMVIE